MKNFLTFEQFINESTDYDKISLYKLEEFAIDDREAALKLVERTKKKSAGTLLAIWNQLRDEPIFDEIYQGLLENDKMSFILTMPEYIKKFGLPNPGGVPNNKFEWFGMSLKVISFLLLDKNLVSDSDKQKVANGINAKQKELITNYINSPHGYTNVSRPYYHSDLKNHPMYGKYKPSDLPKNGELFQMGDKSGNPMINLAKETLSKFGLYDL